MQSVLRDIPSSAALTPEPVLDAWEEHQHLMNPMFLQVNILHKIAIKFLLDILIFQYIIFFIEPKLFFTEPGRDRPPTPRP